jgi:hypothetical protein
MSMIVLSVFEVLCAIGRRHLELQMELDLYNPDWNWEKKTLKKYVQSTYNNNFCLISYNIGVVQ